VYECVLGLGIAQLSNDRSEVPVELLTVGALVDKVRLCYKQFV